MVIICATLITVLAQAQEHMAFKDVSMNCTVESFVSQLKLKGYTVAVLRDNSAILTGSFAGKDNCEIYVYGTDNAKMVHLVAVKFSEHVSWSSLKNEYLSFKKSYTEKYGKPKSYEFFKNPYYEGDGYELQALKLDKCTFASVFTTTGGNIMLYLSDDKCVHVGYEDSINAEIKTKERDNIVSNDI